MLDVISMLPGATWPAIPGDRASQLLAMQFQLQQSQWLSPDKLRELQTRQLSWLLSHAYETVPFYRARFDAMGVGPEELLQPECWQQLPLLRRRDVQTGGESLHCTTGPKEHGTISKAITSGSSGQPVTTLATSVTRLYFSALLLRQHIWHQRDLTLKLAAIRTVRPNPDAPVERFSEGWGPATQGVVKTGPAVSLDIHTTIDQQAEFLLQHDPDYLLTYPSVVMGLATHFAKSDKQLNRLREIRTFGEVLDPKVRDLVREVWGVKMVDNYSAEELGEIASQCPEFEHFHVQSESVLVEVLHEDGRECKPGEVGKVVVTGLQNFAMPLLRYEIGDYAEVGPPCPCGRGLPVLKRIIGRERNLFILPDGRRVWPSPEVDANVEFPPIFQYQLIQRAVRELELLVVSPRQFTGEEVATIRRWTSSMLSPEMSLKITYVDSIPRGVTGKYAEFLCEVEAN